MTHAIERAWSEKEEEAHPRGRGDKGGQFVTKGNEGQSSTKPPTRGTKPPAKKTTGKQPAQTPADIKPEKYKGPLKVGGNNDPNQVRELQALLKVLGLSTRNATGTFDSDTENAVKEAQKRLGLRPTGKASATLVRKMMAAHALSPCIKRNNTLDCDDLVRAEFPNLAAALDDGSLEEEDIVRSDEIPETDVVHTPGHAACCPDVYDDESHVFRREWTLDGLEIVRGGAGDDAGRLVEAYATIFDSPTEIKDQHGHYMETIARSAFDDVLRDGISKVKVFYNHGMHLNGSPSDRWSVPIGVPLEIRPDGRGLRTVTRFNKGEAGDQVIEAIRNGAITGYSFRGPIRQSNPPRIPRSRDGAPLPTVTRTRLGLTEYGPTPTPYYADANILALRSRLQGLDETAWDRLVHLLTASTPEDQEAVRTTITATPEEEGPGAEDQPPQALRTAEELLALRATAAGILTRRNPNA